jgi:hypothetical protein
MIGAVAANDALQPSSNPHPAVVRITLITLKHIKIDLRQSTTTSYYP